jgi:phenylalanine-4-hydroxylase
MKFTKNDHEVWRKLFARQVPNLEKFACKEFLEGFKRLELPADHIPDAAWLHAKIHPLSGWSVVSTPVRYLNDDEWADHMKNKKFPITNFLRTMDELDFTPEPDVFHDIFGHLSMLMNPKLLPILDDFSKMYSSKPKSDQFPIAQLFWNSIEFGLIAEEGEVKAFGAGLMSSFGEIQHISSHKTEAFTLEKGIKKLRAVASFHSSFLLIDSVDQLRSELKRF